MFYDNFKYLLVFILIALALSGCGHAPGTSKKNKP
jgi:hypothetical protein